MACPMGITIKIGKSPWNQHLWLVNHIFLLEYKPHIYISIIIFLDQSPLLSLNDISPMKCHHRFPYKPSFIVANSSFRGEITMIFLYFVGCNISFQPRMLGCQIFSDRIPWKCQINPMSHHEIQPYPAISSPVPCFLGVLWGGKFVPHLSGARGGPGCQRRASPGGVVALPGRPEGKAMVFQDGNKNTAKIHGL